MTQIGQVKSSIANVNNLSEFLKRISVSKNYCNNHLEICCLR